LEFLAPASNRAFYIKKVKVFQLKLKILVYVAAAAAAAADVQDEL
jgi:hypothetical protein